MTKSVDPQRLAKAHKLTAELRLLQDRINQTIDQLCELAGGRDVEEVLGEADVTAPTGADQEVSLTPSFLDIPTPTPYVRNPATGYALGADTRFYSNYRKGLVQLVQNTLPRHADSRYSLVLNYADFDGDLMSIVVDARALMAGQTAGKARLRLLVEAVGNQAHALYAKCAWRHNKKWSERTFEVRPNQASVAAIEIDRLDPEQLQALDIHLLFNPGTRGSLEIRRFTASLSIQPAEEEVAAPASIFESAP